MCEIRNATLQDIPDLIELSKEHAHFEQASYNPDGKLELLSEHLFKTQNNIKCILAELQGEIVGYATFIKQFSTWDAEFYVYLDCLFLRDKARGNGFGEKIMNHIKEYAKSENCKIIEWQTPEFNKRAIKFYKRLGAISKTKERFFWEV